MFKVFSPALKRNRFWEAFLEKEYPPKTVVGWGHKPTADKARRYALKHHLPYLALEDGFLRSVDLGVNGAPPLSLVVDHTGIYYDANVPSDLENFLNTSGWETPELLDSARRAIDTIIHYQLSKYNHAPSAPENLWKNAAFPRVLVLDQTQGDASVNLGCADEKTFQKMLEEALKNYAVSQIWVKTHPDVIAGKKKGYLAEFVAQRGVGLITKDYSPFSLLKEADVIYTVTSQMGLEALMLQKEVHCFGIPFYAGWGLTQDRQKMPRRKKQRSLEELFAAAYLLYARYVNPIRIERCSIHEILSLLTEQKRQNERNRSFHACVGFRWWKRPYARAYLKSTGSAIKFLKNDQAAILEAKKHGGDVVVWSSRADSALQKECDANHVPLTRMEDGFIRSVGLGSNFNWPYSLVTDKKGIYYDPSRPSELEEILNFLPQHPEHKTLLQRAQALRALILEKELTKYNMPSSALPPQFPQGKTHVLVPGQVEDDASVRCGGFGMNNLELLATARKNRPDAFIIYKPHPDVENKNRKGAVKDEEALRYANLILRHFPMGRLLPLVDEVHTLTSQTGFEALLRNLKVFTYGGPFYAGWGLTEDQQSFPRRKVRLTVDELIAGALLLYPSYYDWQTQQFCRAEDVCYRLLQANGQMKGRVWARLITFVRDCWRGNGQ